MADDPHVDAEPDRIESLDPQRRRDLYDAARHAGGDIPILQAMSMPDLMELAQREGIEVLPNLSKPELLFEILRHRIERSGLAWGEGILEVLPDGFGFLRSREHDYRPGPDDVYVSPSQIRSLNLKPGHEVAGPVRPPRRGEKFFALLHVELVNGGSVADMRRRIPFDARTPLLPRERLRLERPGGSATMRILDLLAPWGRGQRVLFATPPQSGRTLLLTQVVQTLLANHPDLHTVVCLLDERPEDITEFRRQAGAHPHCEVVASSFDEAPRRHVELADLALCRVQRMVEAGQHVVLVLDSLTRLVRAWHLEVPHSGKMLAAGLDAAALVRPKRLFGAARNAEEGGSLTVIGTVLTGTGSRIDELIGEEFAGRGNCEVVLDRELAPWHLFPGLDVARTGTRREDCLLDPVARAGLCTLRRELLALPPAARIERLGALLQAGMDNAAVLARH
jgi:transcription termination factor Rho